MRRRSGEATGRNGSCIWTTGEDGQVEVAFDWHTGVSTQARLSGHSELAIWIFSVLMILFAAMGLPLQQIVLK